jgi:RHS repeat-associated protein
MRLRGGSPNVFIDIGRAFCILGVKNLAILAEIDTQKLELSDTLRIFEEFVGVKNYELSNHLGNVLATISDKTIFNTDHYNGIVYSAQLYYPFGWEIPTLSYTAKKYRFGFNGKEDDREWHAQDYGFRLYTSREGRFIGVDPITAQYPELTPYQFASNTPIQAVDLDGLEAQKVPMGVWEGYKRYEQDAAQGGFFPARFSSYLLDRYLYSSTCECKYENNSNEPELSQGNVITVYRNSQKLAEVLTKQANGQSLTAEEKNFLEGTYRNHFIPVDDSHILSEPGLTAAKSMLSQEDLRDLYGDVNIKRSLGAIYDEENNENRLSLKGLVNNLDELETIFLTKLEELTDVKSLDKQGADSGKQAAWYEGYDKSGNKWVLEYEPIGHKTFNEGPHVKMLIYDQDNGKGQGTKGRVYDKIFINHQEKFGYDQH